MSRSPDLRPGSHEQVSPTRHEKVSKFFQRALGGVAVGSAVVGVGKEVWSQLVNNDFSHDYRYFAAAGVAGVLALGVRQARKVFHTSPRLRATAKTAKSPTAAEQRLAGAEQQLFDSGLTLPGLETVKRPGETKEAWVARRKTETDDQAQRRVTFEMSNKLGRPGVYTGPIIPLVSPPTPGSYTPRHGTP